MHMTLRRTAHKLGTQVTGTQVPTNSCWFLKKRKSTEYPQPQAHQNWRTSNKLLVIQTKSSSLYSLRPAHCTLYLLKSCQCYPFLTLANDCLTKYNQMSPQARSKMLLPSPSFSAHWKVFFTVPLKNWNFDYYNILHAAEDCAENSVQSDVLQQQHKPYVSLCRHHPETPTDWQPWAQRHSILLNVHNRTQVLETR